MRSSGSTRNPRVEGGLRLYVHRVGDDHPKACTGRRLLARGLAEAPPVGGGRGERPLALDPHAPRPLSLDDRARAERSGLLVIDCSWNRLAEAGRLPPELGGLGPRRRLPWLLAGNPQHFGRLAELNTAEALSAALYLLGETARATELLSGFPGGVGWFELNRTALEAYRASPDVESLRSAERRVFGPAPGPRPPGRP